jgi:hypothetical protein
MFELKDKKLSQDHYQCTFPGCLKIACWLAHGISKSKVNQKIFGNLINHPYNLFSVCNNPNHNDYFNIGFKPHEIGKLREIIRDCGDGLTSKQVWGMINA